MNAITDISKLDKRLSKAKTSLILEHPFVGTVALNMKMSFDDTINPPTACTNGKRVLFHPEFIETLTDEELKFLVAHECMHPMLEHNYRRYDRDPKKWNNAADYVINKLLVDDKIGKMPEIGLYSDEIYNAGGGTSDGIYKILPDSPEGGGGEGGEGEDGNDPPRLDNCEDGEGTQADKDQQAAEWKVQVAQAAQAAKMMGKLSAGMARLVDEVLNPKVDWRDVLQRFVEKCRNDTRSWARPNRRYIAQGMCLPSMDGEEMGEIVFGVDCSGSCSGEIPQFSNEVRTVHEDHKPRLLHVVYFDSRVCHYEKFDKDDTFHMEGHGGGGTAFSPIFEYLEEHNIEPAACVILTDLCCNDFGDQPQYPVLWVSNDQNAAPWGEVVMM